MTGATESNLDKDDGSTLGDIVRESLWIFFLLAQAAAGRGDDMSMHTSMVLLLSGLGVVPFQDN